MACVCRMDRGVVRSSEHSKPGFSKRPEHPGGHVVIVEIDLDRQQRQGPATDCAGTEPLPACKLRYGQRPNGADAVPGSLGGLHCTTAVHIVSLSASPGRRLERIARLREVQ